jgi:alkanesulfonate monooxygenase SsuD/methylene tetrahydromethanopterin reductase-like flavin-dependent oxidoreductase (luciferase family)
VVTRLRTGVILPTFRETPDDAFTVARAAVAAGVDGIFCYDHVWPLGQPERPALAPFPVLGALAGQIGAAAHEVGGPFLGTLVARVGLVPNAVLAGQFRALEALAPGRVIAGLGTGDRLSADETRAYGVPYPPAAERRAQMTALAGDLVAAGLTVWVGGGRVGRTDEARSSGAAMTVWDSEPSLVRARVDETDAVEVTWAGPPPADAQALAEAVASLHAAGATWVVFGWPVDLEVLTAAARTICA